MNWTEIAIHTTTAGIEPVTAKLLELGIDGLIVEDVATDSRILEEARAGWDYVDEDVLARHRAGAVLKFYIEYREEGQANATPEAPVSSVILEDALQALKTADTENAWGKLTLTVQKKDDQQWLHRWKDYFSPFAVGERLWVVPAWYEEKTPGRRIPLVVDTNLSFGTGQHSTTRLCLELLEKLICPGMRVLDMGCGSGILGVAAALLGASSVTAVDIEKEAIATARHNMERNGILPQDYRIVQGNVLEDAACLEEIGGGYDMICANIVADIICDMARLFAGQLKPGGILLASGILDTRGAEVSKVLEDAGFTVQERELAGGWAAFGCRLK